MADYRTSLCRSCHQPIVWAKTVAGRAMPVDPEPTPHGNVSLRAQPHGQPPLAEVTTVTDLFANPGTARYYAHFVTCPQASEWRRS